MKPHEETWSAEGPLVVICDHAPRGVWDMGTDARAQLTACAPEMARTLLAIERQTGAVDIAALLKKAGVR